MKEKEKETLQDVREMLRAQLGDLRAKEDVPGQAERRPGFPPAVMRVLPLRVLPALLKPPYEKGRRTRHIPHLPGTQVRTKASSGAGALSLGTTDLGPVSGGLVLCFVTC